MGATFTPQNSYWILCGSYKIYDSKKSRIYETSYVNSYDSEEISNNEDFA